MKKMKKAMLIMAALMLSAMAAMAQTISYQAVVRDTANRLVVNTNNIQVKVQIKNGGTVKYSEEHTTVSSNQNGLISLKIGAGTNQTGSMSSVDWKTANVATQVLIPGASDWVSFSGDIQAVPYALYADNVSKDATTIVALYEKVKNDSIIQRNALRDTATVLRSLIGGGGGDILALKDSIHHHYVSNDMLCDKVMDCTGIKTMRDSIQINSAQIQTNISNISNNTTAITNLTTKEQNDSLTLATAINNIANNYVTKVKEQSDSTVLVNRIVTDSAALHEALKDTASAIRGSIHDARFTLKMNGDSVTSFTANASSAVVGNILDRQYSQKFVNPTAGTTVFTITAFPSGYSTVNSTSRLVQMYINGVLVGDNLDGVISVAGAVVTYDPSANEGKVIATTDKIRFVYFVK